MSQIGKKPIFFSKEVSLLDYMSEEEIKNEIEVKGSLGSVKHEIPSSISVDVGEDSIQVNRADDKIKTKELHGLTRSLINNIIHGVEKGHSKELNLVGVGYSAEYRGEFLLLNLGFSHQIYFQIPEDMTVETPNQTTIKITGISKQEVGELAANIRKLRKPEPYKGKGIRYSDEYVRKKAGKTVGIVGT